MANYAADADSIYGPQQAAEQATLDQSQKQTMAGYDQSQAKIDSTKAGYNKALDPYAQAIQKSLEDKNAGVDKSNFDASSSGLMGSGLLGNQQRILGQSYLDNVTQTETERAAKLSDISTARTNATDTYNTNIGALNTKYQGLKNSYIITQQQAADEQAKYQAQLAKAYGAGSGSATSSGSAPSRQGYAGQLNKLESILKGFQASGYQGGNANLGDYASRAKAIADLTKAYKGTISAQEISGYVNQLYNRYGIDVAQKSSKPPGRR